MISRIIRIREESGLSQEKFAERIGLSRNFINQAENGKKNLSDRTISDICREFNVNEDWIRFGTEPIYKKKDKNFSEILSTLEESDDDFIKDLILVYMDLDQDSKAAIRKIADGMAERRKKQD